MADNAPGSWLDLLSALLTHPEKGALLLVLLAGSWRWIRELWKERKDDTTHESLIETLMKENRELREELRKERHSRDSESDKHHD